MFHLPFRRTGGYVFSRCLIARLTSVIHSMYSRQPLCILLRYDHQTHIINKTTRRTVTLPKGRTSTGCYQHLPSHLPSHPHRIYHYSFLIAGIQPNHHSRCLQTHLATTNRQRSPLLSTPTAHAGKRRNGKYTWLEFGHPIAVRGKGSSAGEAGTQPTSSP